MDLHPDLGHKFRMASVRSSCSAPPTAGWRTTPQGHQAPVAAASSWQPRQTGDGQPWAAMDGNVHTMWDPRSTPAWLDLDFGKEITVEAVGVTSGGDITHDIKAFTLETASSPAASPSGTPWQQLPHPSDVRIESRDDFHNIVPMGLPANASEVAELAVQHPSADGVWLFTEPREYKVMMEDRVPVRWVKNGPSSHFNASVQRGEWFYFQLALYTRTFLSVTPQS